MRIPPPYFLIDEQKLVHNLEILQSVSQEAGCKILLAQKAYSVYQTYPLLAKYLAAHRAMDAAELMKINGSTELAFKSGLSCRIIEGDPMNFKITTPEDLSNFKTIIKARKK